MKPRQESRELKCLRILNVRWKLSTSEMNHYINLDKGFEGEKMFDKWAEGLQGDWLKLNDLLFEQNNNLFQIDSLFVTPGLNYLFDVKNYEGDFYIEGDKWYSSSGNEIKNPLLQLQRCESLLRRMLQDMGVNTPIESYLVFVNPQFYLYQAPLNLPIIFPTQLNRFLNKLNVNPPVFKNGFPKYVNKLLSLHKEESRLTLIPQYSFDKLKKGIICITCRSAFYKLSEDHLVCTKCEYREDVSSGILRNVEEYQILFPQRKITTSAISEWCEIIGSKKRIRRILLSKYKPIGYGKGFYYIK